MQVNHQLPSQIQHTITYSGHWLNEGPTSTIRSASAFCTILHLSKTVKQFSLQWRTKDIHKAPNATRSDNQSEEKSWQMPLALNREALPTFSPLLIVIPVSWVSGQFGFKASVLICCTKVTPGSQSYVPPTTWSICENIKLGSFGLNKHYSIMTLHASLSYHYSQLLPGFLETVIYRHL